MADLEEQVRKFIQERRLMPPGERVIAAVSGGPDSLCLMAILQTLDFGVVVAHFDHSLRRESAAEARFVQAIAEKRGLPFAKGEGDVRGYAKLHRKTLEEAARLMRYEFLFGEARRQGVRVIATGHTREDQAETVLMHLLRGAGPSGLRGILPSRDIRRWFDEDGGGELLLVRPILDVSRSQTEYYCRKNGLTPVHDTTNEETIHWRNQIRLRLVPELRRFNPRIIETLARLADLQSAEMEFLDAEIEQKWHAAARMENTGEVRIRRDAFNKEATAVRRRLIRRAIQALLPGIRDLAKRHVDQADAFARTPTRTGKADLALGIKILLDGDWLVFRHGLSDSGKPGWNGVPLPVPGKLELTHPDWCIETEILTEPGVMRPDGLGDPWQVWMDYDRLVPPLRVRVFQAGERWNPMGMNTSVNLADFLAKQKMPSRRRNAYPLISDQCGVRWIPGIRSCEEIRITASTMRLLRIRVIRTNEVVEESKPG